MISYANVAENAKSRLIAGNQRYIASRNAAIDASENILKESVQGQQPYAVIITCSDSRVIPEAIFSAGIGELFVIRGAGNVIDANQLGSIEYATEHLGTELVVVLGHDHCGAIDAALHHRNGGYIKKITDIILKAVGDEKNEDRACRLNVEHSCKVIESNLNMQKGDGRSLKVIGAIYHLESGAVEFL